MCTHATHCTVVVMFQNKSRRIKIDVSSYVPVDLPYLVPTCRFFFQLRTDLNRPGLQQHHGLNSAIGQCHQTPRHAHGPAKTTFSEIGPRHGELLRKFAEDPNAEDVEKDIDSLKLRFYDIIQLLATEKPGSTMYQEIVMSVLRKLD